MQADARALTGSDLASLTDQSDLRIDRVLCTLGFTVVPDWEVAFGRTFGLLTPNGRYAIMDGYFERLTLRARLVNAIAAADVTRRVWEPLQKRSRDIEEETFPFFGGRIFVISGTKPEVTD